MERLKQRRLSCFSLDLWSARAATYTRVFEEYPQEPVIVRRARALSSFLESKPIFLEPDDLIAGFAQSYDYCELYNNRYLFCDPKSISCLGSISEYLGHQGYWRKFSDDFFNQMTEKERETFESFTRLRDIGVFQAGFGHGHVVPDYPRVLSLGLGRLARMADASLTSAGSDDARSFLLSIAIVLQAVAHYIRRYALRAMEMQKETTHTAYRKELQRIADSCQWVAVYPPRSYFEALQLFWLLHEILSIEQICGSFSPGRLDQYLYPYFERDIQKSELTKEAAQELIEVLWIKFNIPAAHWRSLFFQNIVLGGQTPEGNDATNELSFICLEASRKLRLPQPSLSVRIHAKTPESFFREAVRVISKGGGLPALFNDTVAIASKMELGIPYSDAIDYAIVGCVETAVAGKEYGWTEGLRVNWAKILELTLARGTCLLTGKTVKMAGRESGSFNSFEELYSEYTRQLRHFTKSGVEALNIADRYFSRIYPFPYLSILMHGCIEESKDITSGGTKYNFTSINGCGMANVADSLAAIRGAVFKEKVLDLGVLLSSMRSDFAGQEPLRQMLIKKYPKFGNDVDEVDSLMAELCEVFRSTITEARNPRGGCYQAGLYSVNSHASLGSLTAALPDGRKSRHALANSFSPVQGRDLSGPTAVIKSVTKINHSHFANGMVLDLKISPSLFESEDAVGKLIGLIKSYFSLGGFEIQFNVITTEELKTAREHPEDYAGLLVRVSGFSAFFTSLDEMLQEEIIERTEHER